MGDIDEMQRRLSAAMDRVAAALETAVPDQAGQEALRAELEEERLANAQLQSRVKKLKARTPPPDPTLTARLDELDRLVQRLRRTNEALRESNAALRAANAEGMAEPHLINKSMMAELDALRADRGVETAEMHAILAALQPLVPTEPTQEDQDA